MPTRRLTYLAILEWARAAVFLDPQDKQMVVFKGGGPALPLSQCSISPKDRFTFYDQIHSTADRLELPTGALARLRAAAPASARPRC